MTTTKHAVHPNLRGKKKTRSGCPTCKRRRKKCDETRPKCLNCTRLNLECSYELRLSWLSSNQTVIRNWGQLAPRAYYPLVNTAQWQISIGYCVNKLSDSHLVPHLETILPKKPHRSCKTEGYEISAEYLFTHYVRNISTTRTFSDSSNTFNEFFSIIVPRCKDFAALYQSVLCMSSIDLMKQEMNKPEPDQSLVNTYAMMFSKFKEEAINELHTILDHHDISELETLEELVVTFMILCSSEISNSSDKNWANLMKEGCLVFSSLSHEQIMSSKVLMFVYRYFSLRYVFLICTLKRDTLTRFVEECQWKAVGGFFESDVIDHLFGCSPHLLYIIYTLATLSHYTDLGHISKENATQQYMDLWDDLTRLEQKSSENSPELELCARAYLLGAKVYFCSLLSMTKLEVFRDFSSVQLHLIPELVDVLGRLGKVNSKVFFPSWSLLILSSCLRNTPTGEALRFTILEILSVLKQKWPFSTILSLKQAVILIWNVYDLWIEEPGLRARTPFDWRDILEEAELLLALV